VSEVFWNVTIGEVMRRNPLTISIEESIGKALGMMEKHGVSSLIVIDDDDVIGTVSLRDVLERGIDSSAKVKSIYREVPSLSPDHRLTRAASLLAQTPGSKVLPVVGKGLAGVVARYDLMKQISQGGELNGVPVKELMTHPVWTIGIDGTLAKAREMMREKNIRRLIVVDEMGRMKGIITSQDLVLKIYRWRREGTTKGELIGDKSSPLSLPIKGLMSSPVYYATIDSSLGEIAKIMVEKNISGVPILNEMEEIVGIITQMDIIRYIVSLEEREGLPILIAGLDDGISYERRIAYRAAERLAKKASKILKNLHYIRIGIKTYQEKGTKKKYSIRAQLKSSNALYSARASDWNLTKALYEALERLERRLLEDKDRMDQRERKDLSEI
jgi:CBS domain-containing protein/ribosome-associated translation inhibitor RaiA